MIGYRKMIKYERHNYDFNWNSLDNYRNFSGYICIVQTAIITITMAA